MRQSETNVLLVLYVPGPAVKPTCPNMIYIPPWGTPILPALNENPRDTAMTGKSEFVDVLVIGAGLAGIGSACQLRRNMPQLSLVILEARQVSGGTWDLFRYPGIRSEIDMYTYSYGFKPWTAESAIADGDTILKYI